MRELRVPLVVLVLLGAACLPTRDNSHDPSVQPVPVLALSTGPFDHGSFSCGAPDSLEASFNRARCLHVDASGSSDPQNDITSYVLEISTAETFSTSGGFEIPSGLTPAMQVIDFPVSALPDSTVHPGAHQLRLTLIDAAGHSASTVLGVTLVNNLPTAVAPSPRQLPR